MFKFYNCGNDFFNDNKEYLLNTINENSLFITNSFNNNDNVSRDLYFIKIYNKNNFLLLCKKSPYPLLICGDVSLLEEGIKILLDYNLNIEKIQANEELVNQFIELYSSKRACEFKILTNLSTMFNNKFNDFYSKDVKLLDNKDLEEVKLMYKDFHFECFNTFPNSNNYENLENNIKNKKVYGLIIDNKIVSITSITRDFFNTASIGLVFTKKEYRNNGYAKKIVKHLTNVITKDNKTALLYVDNLNPVSNNCYLQLGYEYYEKQLSYEIVEEKYQKAILAGGCFWCMAKPYYEYSGILSVVSGYTGGDAIMPDYDSVKKGKTTHKEAVNITYNKDKMTYEQILDIYLSSIDLFDFEGQFIDKGDSYMAVIYYTDEKQYEISLRKLEELEKIHGRKTCIDLKKADIFYKAEEYHQDYHLKNKEAYNVEFITSKRTVKPVVGRYYKNDKYYEIEVLNNEILSHKEIEFFNVYNNPDSILKIIDELKNN